MHRVVVVVTGWLLTASRVFHVHQPVCQPRSKHPETDDNFLSSSARRRGRRSYQLHGHVVIAARSSPDA